MNFDLNKINDSKVKDIVNRLYGVSSELASIGGQAFLVGGFTRDYLLEKPSDDVDIMVVYPHADKKDKIDKDVAFFLIQAAKIIANNVYYWVVDEEETKKQGKNVLARVWFPLHSNLAKVKTKDDIIDFEQLGDIEGLSNQGTITMVGRRQDEKTLKDVDKLHLDIALARTEFYSPESRKPEVKPATFQGDAYRRDFTINTLAVDISNGQIVDPTGKGVNDLLQKFVLRTPMDPYQTFLDDPLRVLRAIRMKNRFRKPDGTAFDIHPDVQRVFDDPEKMKVLLSRFGEGEKVSMERVQEEIGKMMKVPGFGSALDDLKRLGVLDSADVQFGKSLSKKVVKTLDSAKEDLDEIGKLAVWFHDFEESIKKQVAAGELKKSIKVDEVLRKLKYKNEVVEEVGRLLNALTIAEKKFGDEITDDKVRKLTRDLLHDYSRIGNVEIASRMAMDTLNRFVALTSHVGYKGYDKMKVRLDELGGIESVRSNIDKNVISGLDIMNWGVPKGPMIKDVENQIEELARVLRPVVDRQPMDEAYIKNKLNTPGEWKIINGKIVDKYGNSIVNKYRMLIQACNTKLKKIANCLERIGHFEHATYLDGMIKTGSVDLMKMISEFSKVGDAYNKKEELSGLIDNIVMSNGEELLKAMPELKEIFFKDDKPIEHGSPYHREDMWTHTINVIKSMGIGNISDLKQKVILLLSGVLHDVGKPETKEFVDRQGTGMSEDGRMGLYQYIGHADKSEEISKNILSNYSVANPIAGIVLKLCGTHIKFHDVREDYLNRGKINIKPFRKMLDEFDNPKEAAYLMGVLSRADSLGASQDPDVIDAMGGKRRNQDYGLDVGVKMYDSSLQKEEEIERRRLEKIEQSKIPLSEEQKQAIRRYLIEDAEKDFDFVHQSVDIPGVSKASLFNFFNSTGNNILIGGVMKLGVL